MSGITVPTLRLPAAAACGGAGSSFDASREERPYERLSTQITSLESEKKELDSLVFCVETHRALVEKIDALIGDVNSADVDEEVRDRLLEQLRELRTSVCESKSEEEAGVCEAFGVIPTSAPSIVLGGLLSPHTPVVGLSRERASSFLQHEIEEKAKDVSEQAEKAASESKKPIEECIQAILLRELALELLNTDKMRTCCSLVSELFPGQGERTEKYVIQETILMMCNVADLLCKKDMKIDLAEALINVLVLTGAIKGMGSEVGAHMSRKQRIHNVVLSDVGKFKEALSHFLTAK